MLFSTPIFIFLFLPICLFAYYATGMSNTVLLIFSLIFYAWGEPVLVLVMMVSIVVNYLYGLLIERHPNKGYFSPKFFLINGICFNLLLLIFFKYFTFLTSIINLFTPLIQLPRVPEYHIPLLLGVSFFSFQAMSYLIDVYRMEYHAQRNIFKFALFKTLFPQLIAGPIVRYGECGPQLEQRKHSMSLFVEGIEQFTTGLAKKVLIADICAVSVDKMFEIPTTEISVSVAWAAVLLFSLQIYFDFSGYTDMALGLSKMFGFHFPPNFNYPYSALSMQDFWRRWHMTLSRWFRDYLYIPLGGNRKAEWRTALNLLIVFFLCGLWHGGNITFVAWGLFHGFFLALERTGFQSWLETWPRLLRRVYVLVVILFSWMVFRSSSIEQAIGMTKAMFGQNGWSNEFYSLPLYVDNLTILSALFGMIFSFPIFQWIRTNCFSTLTSRIAIPPACIAPIVRSMSYILLLIISFAFIAAQTHRAFIYFRF